MQLLVSPCTGLLYCISKSIFGKLISLLLFEQAMGIVGWWKPSLSLSSCQDTSAAADSGVQCQNSRAPVIHLVPSDLHQYIHEKHRVGSFNGDRL